MVNKPSVGPFRDLTFEKLHDMDPIGYHVKLARLHASCDFCERRKKEIGKKAKQE